MGKITFTGAVTDSNFSASNWAAFVESSANFGKITSAGAPRMLQFGPKPYV